VRCLTLYFPVPPTPLRPCFFIFDDQVLYVKSFSRCAKLQPTTNQPLANLWSTIQCCKSTRLSINCLWNVEWHMLYGKCLADSAKQEMLQEFLSWSWFLLFWFSLIPKWITVNMVSNIVTRCALRHTASVSNFLKAIPTCCDVINIQHFASPFFLFLSNKIPLQMCHLRLKASKERF
jgi:hypothetical protein